MLEPQQPLPRGQGTSRQPGATGLYLVPGRMLEPQSQHVQPGARSHKELYLGGKAAPTRAKVKWDTLTLPIAKGGLGIIDPKSQSEALLAKLLVRGLAPRGQQAQGKQQYHVLGICNNRSWQSNGDGWSNGSYRGQGCARCIRWQYSSHEFGHYQRLAKHHFYYKGKFWRPILFFCLHRVLVLCFCVFRCILLFTVCLR